MMQVVAGDGSRRGVVMNREETNGYILAILLQLDAMDWAFFSLQIHGLLSEEAEKTVQRVKMGCQALSDDLRTARSCNMLEEE